MKAKEGVLHENIKNEENFFSFSVDVCTV